MSNRFALDPKHFKHVSSDKEKTVLQHKHGHQITIAHSKLSPVMRKQLEALAPKEETPKMAEGGILDKASNWMAEKRRQGTFGTSVQESQKIDDQKAGRVEHDALPSPINATIKYKEKPKMADGGSVTDEEDLYSPESPDITTVLSGQGEAPPATIDTVPMIDDVTTSEAGELEPVTESLPAASIDNVTSTNSDLGMMPGAEASLATLAPAAMSTAATTGAPTGANLQIAGINAAAKATDVQGKAEAKALADQKIGMADAKAKYEDLFNKIEADRQQIIQEMANGDISPDKYWTGDSKGNGGHSKVAAAIGMILSGFGGWKGLESASNFLQQQIEHSMTAQKENLGKKKTLLEANLRQFGNIKDAMMATRMNLNDATINELQAAAAVAKGPMAKAAAMQAIGQIQMKQQATHQKLAMSQMIGALTSGQLAPETTEAALRALEAVDPKQAKELRERQVPGIGFATTNEGGKVMREMGSMTKSVMQGIEHLNQILNTPMKSLSLKARKDAETTRNAMIGALRIPMTGPGAMNEGERQLMMDMIPGVADSTSIDASSRQGLQSLARIMQEKYAAAAEANGIKLPHQANTMNPNEGKTATNAQGQKIIMKNGKWVPVGQ